MDRRMARSPRRNGGWEEGEEQSANNEEKKKKEGPRQNIADKLVCNNPLSNLVAMYMLLLTVNKSPTTAYNCPTNAQ